MSTKEIAMEILERFTEEQLKAFIALFGGLVPEIKDPVPNREAAFEQLEKMRKHIPNLDEKKELSEYRQEKYS